MYEVQGQCWQIKLYGVVVMIPQLFLADELKQMGATVMYNSSTTFLIVPLFLWYLCMYTSVSTCIHVNPFWYVNFVYPLVGAAR